MSAQISSIAKATNYGPSQQFPTRAGNLYIEHLRSIDIFDEELAREIRDMYPGVVDVEFPGGPAKKAAAAGQAARLTVAELREMPMRSLRAVARLRGLPVSVTDSRIALINQITKE